jgi:hypothetical protein
VFPFPAVAVDAELFVCVVASLGAGWEASSVGIQIQIDRPFRPDPFGSGPDPTTTDTLEFVGVVCAEVPVAVASWVVGALWVAVCDWPPEPSPAWVCEAVCVVVFELDEPAVACEELVCVTGPSFPGESTLITTLTLVGAVWVDVAVASAFWVVGAAWLDVCDCPAAAGLGAF